MFNLCVAKRNVRSAGEPAACCLVKSASDPSHNIVITCSMFAVLKLIIVLKGNLFHALFALLLSRIYWNRMMKKLGMSAFPTTD